MFGTGVDAETIAFQKKTLDFLACEKAAGLSVFTANGGGIGSAGQAGDRLFASLCYNFPQDGHLYRLSQTSTAVLHAATPECAGQCAEILDEMDPFGGAVQCRLDLIEDDTSRADKIALIGRLLTSAGQTESVTRSGTIARTSPGTETDANQTRIDVAARAGSPEDRIGIAHTPDLVGLTTSTPMEPSKLIAGLLRQRLRTIADAKPDHMPVYVPLNAAILFQLEPKDWKEQALAVLPVGFRALASDLQERAADQLSQLPVMADVADLAFCPAVFTRLLSARALSHLRVDTVRMDANGGRDREALLKIVEICAGRGIHVLLNAFDKRLSDVTANKPGRIFVSAQTEAAPT